MKRSDVSNPRNCEICGRSFTSATSHVLHMRAGHNSYKQQMPECALCGKTFTRRVGVILHLAKVHGESTNFTCTICKKVFTSEKTLKRHTGMRHNPSNPVCDDCDKTFRTTQALIAHAQSAHDVTYEDLHRCHLCGKVFCWNDNLEKHLTEVHGETVVPEFKCEFCYKAYTTNYCLSRHIEKQHNLEFTNKTCEACSKASPAQTVLESRQQTLDIFDGIPCECGKILSSESALKRHIRAYHPFDVFKTAKTSNEPKTRFRGKRCEVCNKDFDTLQDLRDHMKASHEVDLCLATCNVCFARFLSKVCVLPENDNRCCYCDKLFTSKPALLFHVDKFHAKEAEFNMKWGPKKCEYCGNIYKNARTLKNHIDYVHLGKHPSAYKCVACEMYFKQKTNLRRHIRTKHTNSSVFAVCHLCDMPFESAKACQEHLKTIHSYLADILPCEMCPKTFGSKQELMEHVRLTHGKLRETKCEHCGFVIDGSQTYESHKEQCTELLLTNALQSPPTCVLCFKSFKSKQTLRHHIKMIHDDSYKKKKLARHASENNVPTVKCRSCVRGLADPKIQKAYLASKDADAVIFKCKTCSATYNSIEFAVYVTRENRTSVVSEVNEVQEAEQEEERPEEPEFLTADQLEASITELDIAAFSDLELDFSDNFSDNLSDNYSDNFSDIETDSECDDLLTSDVYLDEARKLLMPTE